MTSRTEEKSTYTVMVYRRPDPNKRVRNPPLRDFESWYDADGKNHRVNGPAHLVYDIDTGVVIREMWHRHGKAHRTDGPAAIMRDANTGRVISSSWYIDGERVPAPGRPAGKNAPAPTPSEPNL